VLVDTHCHLDDPPLHDRLSAVLGRARDAGVTRVLVPGVRPAQWASIAAMRDAHPDTLAIAVGLHPQCLPELDAPAVDVACASIVEAARRHGAVAIGECGLDRETTRAHGVSLERQASVLGAHCDAARVLGLPLVVHVQGAMGAALAFFEARGPLPYGGVLHGFGGPAELVPRWAALGFSFGIGPPITWPRARRPKEAARRVPRDRILLETDGPGTYVAGTLDRVGEPAQVRDVLGTLATLRGEDAESLARATTDNARRLFPAWA
jgi:TatD DNase family protein